MTDIPPTPNVADPLQALARQVPAPFDAPAAWVKAAERLGLDEDRKGSRVVATRGVATKPSPKDARRVLPAAVVAILVIVAAMGALRINHRLVASGHEYVTAAGQRLSVTLQDGTRVALGPASQLRVPYDYETRRVADLEGEAYFTVVHDPVHPFAVRTHDAITRDVGTSFDVRAYGDGEHTQVAVAEGRVMVGTGDLRRSETLLVAGDVGEIMDNGTRVQHPRDLASYFAWRQGTLVFDDTPLRDVTREIERTFAVKITVADSALLTKRITGTLTNRPLEFILNVVTQAVGARYERTNKGVIIRNGVSKTEGPRQGPVPPLTTVQLGELRK